MAALIWMMMGSAQAGQVWVTVDDPAAPLHLEIPGAWVAEDDELGPLVKAVDRGGVGTLRSLRRGGSTVSVEHRPDPVQTASTLVLEPGRGFTLSLDLGSNASAATATLSSTLDVQGVHIGWSEHDVLADLRAGAPTEILRTRGKQGGTVVLATK